MKRLICLSILTLGTLLLCTAQEPRNGTLKLKSGIEVRGAIKENKSASSVEITTAEGDTFVYNTNEIKKLSFHSASRSLRFPSQHGFQSSVSISGGIGIEENYNISVDYIAGMRFNDHYFLGAGTGINYIYAATIEYNSYDKLYVPLYAHFRTYFFKKSRVQPFAAASVGGLFSTKGPALERGCRGGNIIKCSHILFMAEPSVGINFRTSKKTSVYFNIGGMIYQLPYLYDIENYTAYIHKEMEFNLNFHLGFTF